MLKGIMLWLGRARSTHAPYHLHAPPVRTVGAHRSASLHRMTVHLAHATHRLAYAGHCIDALRRAGSPLQKLGLRNESRQYDCVRVLRGFISIGRIIRWTWRRDGIGPRQSPRWHSRRT